MKEGINPVVNGLNLFTAIIIAIFIITILVGHLWSEMRNYVIGSIIGLGLGSAIIGVVVWAYSQVFILPKAVGGGFQLPLYATVLNFVWTFGTEIPFMILIGPPILKVCQRAFPSLNALKKE
jgi:drug/metabolite transporter (DMT)-like permease